MYSFKNPILFFTLSLVSLIFLPRLFSLDQFFDGVMYAAIARNFAAGEGSLFRLFYHHGYHFFWDHPPLAIWLHSLFYRVFGDFFVLDRIYGYAMTFCSVYVMAKIWFRLVPNYKSIVWWPIFLFFIQALTWWTSVNNMLELTMGFFTLASVYFWIYSFTNNKKWETQVLSLLALFANVLALLAKGPVGLFPIVTPLLLLMTGKKTKSFVTACVGAFGLGALLVGLLSQFLPDQANEYLRTYFEIQVLGNLEDRGHTEFNYRRSVFRSLINNLLPLIAICIIQIKRKSEKIESCSVWFKWSLFFLTLGVSASFPIAFSHKQSGYYLYPSTFFYGLATAFFSMPLAVSLDKFVSSRAVIKKRLVAGGYVILFASCVLAIAAPRKFDQRREFVYDLAPYLVNLDSTSEKKVSLCGKELYGDWAAMAYGQRFFRMSFFKEPGHNFLLKRTSNSSCDLSQFPDYQMVKTEGEGKFYQLYVKNIY